MVVYGHVGDSGDGRMLSTPTSKARLVLCLSSTMSTAIESKRESTNLYVRVNLIRMSNELDEWIPLLDPSKPASLLFVLVLLLSRY